MDHRIGICSACGAHYKIPASFTPNQARCRTCSGVVHITPANGADVHARGAPRQAEPRRETREDAAALAPSSPSGAMTEAPAPVARVVERADAPVAAPERETTPAPLAETAQAPRVEPAPSRTRRVALTAALILAVFIGVWIWWVNRSSTSLQAHATGSPGGAGTASAHDTPPAEGDAPSPGH